MTACKDSLSGKKAVSATLVGVLAVGMVPAAAFAATAQADTTGEDGISLLATDAQAFYAGSVSEVTVGGDKADVNAAISFKADGVKTVANVVPTKVKPAGQQDAVDVAAVKYYKADSVSTTKINGKKVTEVQGSAIAKPGTYYAVALNATGDNVTTAPAVEFTVTAADIEDVYVTTAANEYKQKDLTFDGATKIQDVVLGYGDAVWTKEGVTATLYKDGTAVGAANDDYLVAGSYTYRLKGDDDTIYEGLQKDITFTVGKYDLSDPELSISDRETTEDTVSLNDVNNLGAGIDHFVQLTKVSGSAVTSDKGSYTYKLEVNPNLTPADKAVADANITGSKELTYNVVADKDVSFKYDTQAWDSITKTGWAKKADTSLANGNLEYTIDRSAQNFKALDLAKITGSYGTTDATDLKAGEFTVSVTDAKTGAAVSDATVPGKYVVTATANAAALDYAHGDDATYKMTINVIEGSLTSADVIFSYDGQNVNQANSATTPVAEEYTGSDFAEDVTVLVKSGSKTLAEGTDYTVKYQEKGTDGVWADVDSIVNAGSYRIQVKSDTYTLNQELYFNVTAKQVTNIRLKGLTKYDGGEFMPYTGEEIVPVVEYDTGKTDAENKAIWAVLPADAYTASYSYKATAATVKAEDVDAVKEIGFYEMKIKSADTELGKNYNLANAGIHTSVKNDQNETVDVKSNVKFEVANKKVFADVATTDWFYNEVYKAQGNGYVKGIAGTDLYAPNAGMTRGDVCVVLLRMAGGDLDYLADGSVNTTIAYNTKFSDVDPHVYYAKAIQWASQLGIVTGFDGTDEFGPEQTVTRDQFATMLARYAKATGADIAADASAIDAYADASAVESWATPYVAWAVEAGVMGQNTDFLMPVKDVSRAEVAAMAVRYQPKATTTDLVK